MRGGFAGNGGPLRRGRGFFLAAFASDVISWVMPRFLPLWCHARRSNENRHEDRRALAILRTMAQSSEITFSCPSASGVPPATIAVLVWFDGVKFDYGRLAVFGFFRYAVENNSMSYQVVLEPSGQPWVYLLHPAAINDTRMKRKARWLCVACRLTWQSRRI